MAISLVLYNIRSVYNVGSLFRTADGAGVKKMYLVGYTPTPIDRFGRVRQDLYKTALGAEQVVPWEYVKDWRTLHTQLRSEEGSEICAIEQASHSISYTSFNPQSSTVNLSLVLGPEVEGLPSEVLADCDHVLEIPMHGEKESLNVAVAGAVVMYELTRRLGDNSVAILLHSP